MNEEMELRFILRWERRRGSREREEGERRGKRDREGGTKVISFLSLKGTQPRGNEKGESAEKKIGRT